MDKIIYLTHFKNIDPPMIYMVGKLWISAFSWYFQKKKILILLTVRISGTHPDRFLNSSLHCVINGGNLPLVEMDKLLKWR